ncbi:MAG: epoxyqueuosine reductase [Eubacteriaceae bacterium]|jgi:epoxyqueuosine reductase
MEGDRTASVKIPGQIKLDEERIRLIAEKHGAPMAGFLLPEPLEDCLEILEQRRGQGRYTEFEGRDPAVRTDFRNFYPKAETVIVIGVPYPFIQKQPAPVAALFRGEDYHRRIRRIMTEIVGELKQIDPGLKARCSVDNPRLVDRWSAWRAGLGFFGRNNLLISPEYGSFFNIGQILINRRIPFQTVHPLNNHCGSCRACLDACPAGALEQGLTLIPERCQSYLTQKKILTEPEEAMITDSITGCDRCQLVCPWNLRAAEKLGEKAGIRESELPALTIREAADLTDEAWHHQFDDSCASWLSPEIIRRNAGILLKK